MVRQPCFHRAKATHRHARPSSRAPPTRPALVGSRRSFSVSTYTHMDRLPLLIPTLCAFATAAVQDWAKLRLEKTTRHYEYVKVMNGSREVTAFITYPEVKTKASALGQKPEQITSDLNAIGAYVAKLSACNGKVVVRIGRPMALRQSSAEQGGSRRATAGTGRAGCEARFEAPKSFLSTLKAGFFPSARARLETALLAGGPHRGMECRQRLWMSITGSSSGCRHHTPRTQQETPPPPAP